jgi:hypothetical protein
MIAIGIHTHTHTHIYLHLPSSRLEKVLTRFWKETRLTTPLTKNWWLEKQTLSFVRVFKKWASPTWKKSVHKTLSLKFLFLVCLNSPCRRRASCPCVSGGEGVNPKSYSLCTFPCRIQQHEILTVSPTTPIPVAGVFYAAFCSISPNFPVCPFRISCVSWFRRRIGLWKILKIQILAPTLKLTFLKCQRWFPWPPDIIYYYWNVSGI